MDFDIIAAVIMQTPVRIKKPCYKMIVQISLGDGLVFHLTPPEFEEQGYPESGLYRSGELIYSFDEWELWSSSRAMYFSDDAMTFLVLTGWHKGVIRFYERGVMTNSHQVQDLLRRNHSVLDRTDEFGGRIVSWINWDNIHHDRTNNRLQIITIEESEITFDLSTGAILSHHMPQEPNFGQIITMMAIIVGALLILGGVVFLKYQTIPKT